MKKKYINKHEHGGAQFQTDRQNGLILPSGG